MSQKEVKRLIVGADDSNHAGTAKGEIIVAVFSFLPEDGIVKDFKNIRDWGETKRWLKSENREYLFTILKEEEYRHSCQNLVTITPKLIIPFMEEKEIITPFLYIFLDGILKIGNRDVLRNKFLGFHGIERVVVDNFVKKKHLINKKIVKHPHCPAVVYHADVLANYHYTSTFEDPRYVKID